MNSFHYFLALFFICVKHWNIQKTPAVHTNSQALGMSQDKTTITTTTTTMQNYDDTSHSQQLFLNDFSIQSNPFWKAIAIYAIADTVGFVISIVTGWHIHLDLIGTGAFTLVSVSQMLDMRKRLSVAPVHQVWSSLAVACWSAKLAGFLCYRSSQVGHDRRLEDTLSTIPGMFGFWFVTFEWNVICSLPYLLGLLSNKCNTLYVQLGGLIFLTGWTIETMADYQKWYFKQSNPGRLCNVGLWAISQHPNFFGNILLWIGILMMNIPALVDCKLLGGQTMGKEKQKPFAMFSTILSHVLEYQGLLFALLSPMFLSLLFGGQALGLITNTTELFQLKYGNDPAYQHYIHEVPLLFPKIW